MSIIAAQDRAYKSVRRSEPCPICGKPDNCSVSADRTRARCGRVVGAPDQLVNKGGQSYWRLGRDGQWEPVTQSIGPYSRRPNAARATAAQAAVAKASPSLEAKQRLSAAEANQKLYEEAGCFEINVEHVAGLPIHGPCNRDEWAKHLGLPADGLDRAGVRYAVFRTKNRESLQPVGLTCILIPERTANSYSYRFAGDVHYAGELRQKIHPAKTSRGCTPVEIADDSSGWMQCVEGLTDLAVASGTGMSAVSRPNNRMGAADLANIVPRNKLLIAWGENDQKADGLWPGIEGAQHVAIEFCNRTLRPAKRVLPPPRYKDPREWWHGYCDRTKGNKSHPSPETCRGFRSVVSEHIKKNAVYIFADDELRQRAFGAAIRNLSEQIDILCELSEGCGPTVLMASPHKHSENTFGVFALDTWCKSTRKCETCARLRELQFCRDLLIVWQERGETLICRAECDADAAASLRRRIRRQKRDYACMKLAGGDTQIIWTNLDIAFEPADASAVAEDLLSDAMRTDCECARRLTASHGWKLEDRSSENVYLGPATRESMQAVARERGVHLQDVQVSTWKYRRLIGTTFTGSLDQVEDFAADIRERDNPLEAIARCTEEKPTRPQKMPAEFQNSFDWGAKNFATS